MMGFLKKAFSFVGRPTYSRTLIMIVLVAAVSLTVVASQQQQTTKQRAAFLESPDLGPTDPTPNPTTIPPRCNSLASGNLDCASLQNGNGQCKDPKPTKCLVDSWGTWWDHTDTTTYGKPVVCCNVPSSSTPINTPTPTAVPTSVPTPTPTPTPIPTTTPNLFTCKELTVGRYKGSYSCYSLGSGGIQCPSGWSESNPPSAVSPDLPFTGTTCAKYEGCCKAPDATPTPTPTVDSTACIKKTTLDSLVLKYLQGYSNVTLEDVNAKAIDYRYYPCR